MKKELKASLTHPLVSVIIANWNGKQLLAECLDSLAAQTFNDFETIVVDNGSRDGSAAYIRKTHPAVRIVELDQNLGYAGGNNAGIEIASGRYLAFLNNDTRLDPTWLEKLVGAAEADDDSVGMWASKILSYANPRIIDNVGLVLYPDGLGRGKGRLEADGAGYGRAEEALAPSGCAGLYRKEVVEQIGPFDEDFFAYADDVDLGLRARLAGWGCRYVPEAVVYHKYSASSSSYSPIKAFLVERNRIWVLLKCFPIEQVLVSPYFTIKRLLMHLYAAMRGKGASGKFSEQYSVWHGVKILLKAWSSAFWALPRVLRKRRKISRLRKINRAEWYRLLRTFRISGREIALKE